MHPEEQPIQLHPDLTLVISQSRVVGGKETHREKLRDEMRGQTHEVEHNVQVKIANKEERDRAEKLVEIAKHAIRKHATNTRIGSLASREKTGLIRQELEEIRARAIAFNATAETCHVLIGMIPIEIAVAIGPEAARALADQIREELTLYRDALRAGDETGARNAKHRTKNLDALAVGIQADAIRLALDEGRERYNELFRRGGFAKGSGDGHEDPASVGRSFDLGMLEIAIQHFSYAQDTGEGANL